jgi:ABC-type nitrate/sulfonate/bicarbonate transport system substrate-binding protein
MLISFAFFPANTSAADKLRISYASVTGNTAGITYIAQRAGLFEKQGLDVELILITGGPASISALLNGDVDLDMRAPVAALQAMAHGVKLIFLLSQSNTLEYDVVTRPEIKDIKQLKGKKVGIIRFGGISELMVRYLFQKLGLDADKDIAIVQVGQARFIAMEKGAIDAMVLASAESAYAKRNGRHADFAVFRQYGGRRAGCRGEAGRCNDTVHERLFGRGAVLSQRASAEQSIPRRSVAHQRPGYD